MNLEYNYVYFNNEGLELIIKYRDIKNNRSKIYPGVIVNVLQSDIFECGDIIRFMLQYSKPINPYILKLLYE